MKQISRLESLERQLERWREALHRGGEIAEFAKQLVPRLEHDLEIERTICAARGAQS